ncbi:MAG: hypothetical protein JWN22_2217 [Nocardioides sp.]|nr:hypothetical protein [Nocardioides sp.]
MSEGTPSPPPSDNPYGAGSGQTPPPPPPYQPPTGGPGGYGASAPPPPPPGPLGSGGAYSPTDAFSYAWAKFKAKPGELLVPVLVVFVVIVVVEVIVSLLLGATLLGTHNCTRTIFGQSVETQCGPGFFVRALGYGVSSLLVSLIIQALGAGLIKNALNVADGKPASLGEIATWATNPRVITAALIVAVATAVGTVLCYLPGLVVGFLLNWTMFFVVDKGMEPVDAIKASVKFTTDHLGDTVVFYLLAIVVFIVGAILCLVGLLVAAPLVLIAAAFTFRKLQGEQVTPAA